MAKVVKSTREIVNVDEELTKIQKKDKNVKKKTTKTTKTSKKKEKKNSSNKRKGISKFLHEVRNEISKVKWPTKKEMGKYSLATIVFILFFAVFFYLIELVLALLKMGV